MRVFDVTATARCPAARSSPKCTVGGFDGFRLDESGRIWTSAGDGVHVYDPDGTLIGKVLVPETVANVAWGGAEVQPPLHLRDDVAVRDPASGARREDDVARAGRAARHRAAIRSTLTPRISRHVSPRAWTTRSSTASHSGQRSTVPMPVS